MNTTNNNYIKLDKREVNYIKTLNLMFDLF